VIQTFGIIEQQREPDEADRITEATDDPDELKRVLSGHDLLCGHAHWKLAQQAHAHAEPSFEHFLAAAIAAPDNPVAWLNTMVHSHAEEPDLAMDVAMTARRFAGHDILDMLLTRGDPADHELAQEIDRLFDALPDDAPPLAEIRQVGQQPDQVIARRVHFRDTRDSGDTPQ
jgi:hypothetical protein